MMAIKKWRVLANPNECPRPPLATGSAEIDDKIPLRSSEFHSLSRLVKPECEGGQPLLLMELE
jgi:hypothetical protein